MSDTFRAIGDKVFRLEPMPDINEGQRQAPIGAVCIIASGVADRNTTAVIIADALNQFDRGR